MLVESSYSFTNFPTSTIFSLLSRTKYRPGGKILISIIEVWLIMLALFITFPLQLYIITFPSPVLAGALISMTPEAGFGNISKAPARGSASPIPIAQLATTSSWLSQPVALS